MIDPYRLLFKLEGPTTRRVRHHREVQQHWKITIYKKRPGHTT